jgi:hypothetical protein
MDPDVPRLCARVLLHQKDLIGNYPTSWNTCPVSGYTAEDMLPAPTSRHIYGIPSVTIARSYYTENVRTDWLKTSAESRDP